VSCTKSENRNLGMPRQLVECVAFLVGWVFFFPFGLQVTFDVRLGYFIGQPGVFLLKCSPLFSEFVRALVALDVAVGLHPLNQNLLVASSEAFHLVY
jgi:hypothetical protein